MAAPPIPQIDGYHNVRHFRDGGQSHVYVGEDTKHARRTVAIKIPKDHSPAAIQRFLQESANTMTMKHPHVVGGLDCGNTVSGIPFLVTRFFDRGSLGDLLKERPRQPWREAARIAREIACAAQYVCEDRRLVHCDIKPDNVLMDRRGRARLSDFGLATAVTGRPLGLVAGTPYYMSPEQASGGNIDARSAIWSIGVVLYRMLTGELPFTGESLVSDIVSGDPVPPRQKIRIPAGLEQVVLTCLQKRPVDRYTSPIALVEALRDCERRWWTRVRMWSFIGLSALIAISLSLWWEWPDGNRAGAPEYSSRPKGDEDSSRTGSSIDVNPPKSSERPVSSAAPLEMQDFAVDYLESVDGDFLSLRRNGNDQPPRIGDGVYSCRNGDAAQLTAKFSRPAYAYLMAFRADGEVEFVWPNDENEQPPLAREARYPSQPAPQPSYKFANETGLWAFMVVASSKPLPTFQAWLEARGAPPWPANQSAPEDVVWEFNRTACEPIVAPNRAKGAVGRTPAILMELVRWAESDQDIELVEGRAFLVQPSADIVVQPLPELPKLNELSVDNLTQAANRLSGRGAQAPQHTCEGDAVGVNAAFSIAMHFFIVVIHSDCALELYWPLDAQSAPQPLAQLTSGHRPPFHIRSGTSSCTFLVIASTSPLPSFADWRKDREPVPGSELLSFDFDEFHVKAVSPLGETWITGSLQKTPIFNLRGPSTQERFATLRDLARWAKSDKTVDISRGKTIFVQRRARFSTED